MLLQAKEKEVQEWIYCMDPLLAGSIKYVTLAALVTARVLARVLCMYV